MRKQKIISTKYRISANIGDSELLCNYRRVLKFDPEPHIFINIDHQGHRLCVERETDGKLFFRHPDDVKCSYASTAPTVPSNHTTHMEKDIINRWHRIASSINHDGENGFEDSYFHMTPYDRIAVDNPANNNTDNDNNNGDNSVSGDGLHHSNRLRTPNPRYLGDNYVNTL